MLRSVLRQCHRVATSSATLSCTSQTGCSYLNQVWYRPLSSGKSKALGMRLRGRGGIPGPKYGGKESNEMTTRSESILESIRTPKPVTNPIRRWRILRGDFVEVISGPEKGKRGRVLEVVRASNRVVVEGVGYVNKAVPQLGTERKKIVRTEAPIYVTRVALVCPKTDKPTRVRFAFIENENAEDGAKDRIIKVRVAVKSGAIIPRPEILKHRRKKRPEDSPKDTPPTVVMQRTFSDDKDLYEQLQGFESVIEIFPNKS